MVPENETAASRILHTRCHPMSRLQPAVIFLVLFSTITLCSSYHCNSGRGTLQSYKPPLGQRIDRCKHGTVSECGSTPHETETTIHTKSVRTGTTGSSHGTGGRCLGTAARSQAAGWRGTSSRPPACQPRSSTRPSAPSSAARCTQRSQCLQRSHQADTSTNKGASHAAC